MKWHRRDFLRLMLATAAAESVDFERLLWTPTPIVTVPARGVWVVDHIMFKGIPVSFDFAAPAGNYIKQPESTP